MREIKYQIWDGSKMNLVGGIVFNKGKIVEVDADHGECICYEVPDEMRLREYTGLHDKNGKEIYEGDKVRWYTYDGYIGETVVQFKNGQFYPVAEGCLEWQRYHEKEGFEVIGNIYENPELLTVKQ